MKRVLVVLLGVAIHGFTWAQNPVTKLTFEEAVTIGLQRNVILNQQKNQMEATHAQKLNAVGNYFPEKENDLIRILQSSRTAVYIVAIMATFTAPLVEEVVYRGVLYSAFQRTFGIPAAFVLVTALFAIVHVPQYYPSYSTLFLLTVLSLTLTAIRVKSNNLLPCVILHTLFNGIQSVFLILRPDFAVPVIPDQAASLLYLLR